MSGQGVRAERYRTPYGRLYAPVGDSVIGRSLRIYGEWAESEIEAVSRFIHPTRGIVDVGANIGTHTLAFACRFPQATVLSIEPQPLIFTLLAANIVTNELRNVRPIQAAIGDTVGLIRLSIDYDAIDNTGAVTLEDAVRAYDDADGTGTPTVLITLDALVDSAFDVGFIKVDVEGMEAAVLRGARATIDRCRPTLFFEVLTLEVLEACRTALSGQDYTLFWLKAPAFRRDNFNDASENIWSRGELGVLGVPTERAGGVRFDRVPDQATEIPASPPE